MADKSICSIEGCGKPHQARGWCKMHYTRWLRHGGLERKNKRIEAICAVEGCSGVVKSRGWCNNHYNRWRRYGDPTAGRTSTGEASLYFENVVLGYEGEDCLIWPFCKNLGGRGTITIDKKTEIVSRLVCIAVHGEPPTPGHHAAHSCGNGDLGCVTKRHLSWKTPVENQADMIAHGRSQRGLKHHNVKLTEEAVREIRRLRSRCSQAEIARRFGVSQRTIYNIDHGLVWGWVA